MRWKEIIGETASSGASAAGNIASVPGGGRNPSKGSIGAGFDANGHQGIYQNSKGKSKKDESEKPSIIRR